MMYINLLDRAERNFYGITADQADELMINHMSVAYDEESECYTIFDQDGNDIDCVSSMEEFEF